MCPICGYDKLPGPAEDFLICPSCGTEFGYHDAAPTPEAVEQRWKMLRDRWLATGPRWHSRLVPKPHDWDPFHQVMREGLALGLTSTATLSETKIDLRIGRRSWLDFSIA